MRIDKSRCFWICVASLFVLFFTQIAHADNGTLQVKCLELSGTPSQNARVLIVNMINQKMRDKKSDAQGMAEFARIEDGVYRVIARKEGFAPALYEFAVLKGNTESVTLNLAPGADKKLYFEDAAEEQRALQLLGKGLEAAKQNQYAEAEKLFTETLEIYPSSLETLYYFGWVNVQQGKFDRAVELMNQAIKIAEARMSLPPSPGTNRNTYEVVAQNARQTLKQMPVLRAEHALRQKNWDLAISILSDAMKSDPGNPDYYSNMAIALTNTGKLDEAIAMVDKAIGMKPSEKAYADLKAKIVARKENLALERAQGLMNEGNKLLQDGDAEAALKKYEEARGLIKEERQAPLWLQMGRAYAKLNQAEAAVAAFKKSLEHAPADRVNDYRSAYAQFYIDAGKYDEAINVLSQGNGESASEQALLELVKTWKNKEPRFAIAALEKVIQINPANAEAYFDLGQLYYAEGRSKDSRTKELLNKYLEIGKDEGKIQGAKDMLVIVNKRSK